MTWIDFVIVACYLTAILIVGIVVSRGQTIEDFLVNRRNTKTSLLTFTVISTSIGGGTTVGLVAIGFEAGLVGSILGVCYSLGLLLTGLLASRIKRIGDRYNCFTLPDFFEVRYSRKCKLAGGIINLMIFFFFMAAQFIALGTFIKIITGWSFVGSILVGSAVVIVYTSLGGLKSVFYTDFVQFWILFIVLLFILFPLAIVRSGGFGVLKSLPHTYFTGTGYGVVFIVGAFLFLAPSILCGMDMWQRIFAAVDESTARRSMFLGALIILPFFFVFPMIGMFAKIMFPDIAANLATAKICSHILPPALLGLTLAAFMAALMSTADSMLIVASANITRDICQSFISRKVPDKRLVAFTRVVTLGVGCLGVLITLIIPDIVQLIVAAFSSLAILLPAVVGGIFWKRATSRGAFVSILIGFMITVGLTPLMPKTAFVPGILLSVILFIVVSLFTSHDDEEKVDLLEKINGC